MAEYFGMVDLCDIENRWENHEATENLAKEQLLTEDNLKIVHYSDCQQLIIWLPSEGRLYDQIILSDEKSGKEVWRRTIADIISGSIQIILDTLLFRPAKYSILIQRKDGLHHIVHVRKYKEGQLLPPKPAIQVVIDEEKPPIVYRDGFGNIIVYGDLDENMERLR